MESPSPLRSPRRTSSLGLLGCVAVVGALVFFGVVVFRDSQTHAPLAPTPSIPSVPGQMDRPDPTILANTDLNALLDYLRQRGIAIGEANESRAHTLYPVPGVAFQLSNGNLYVHPFPDSATARARALQIPPELTPTLADWIAPPHWFKCRSALVLYLGSDTSVLGYLSEYCGNEFAGGS